MLIINLSLNYRIKCFAKSTLSNKSACDSNNREHTSPALTYKTCSLKDNLQLMHSLRTHLEWNYYYWFPTAADEISSKTPRRFPIKVERKRQKQAECWKDPVQLNTDSVSVFFPLAFTLIYILKCMCKPFRGSPQCPGTTVWLETIPTPPNHFNNKASIQNTINNTGIINASKISSFT